MEIKWKIDDGGAGIHSEQTIDITPDDIYGYDDINNAMSEIEETVQEEFIDNVGWEILNYDELVKWAQTTIDKDN